MDVDVVVVVVDVVVIFGTNAFFVNIISLITFPRTKSITVMVYSSASLRCCCCCCCLLLLKTSFGFIVFLFFVSCVRG